MELSENKRYYVHSLPDEGPLTTFESITFSIDSIRHTLQQQSTSSFKKPGIYRGRYGVALALYLLSTQYPELQISDKEWRTQIKQAAEEDSNVTAALDDFVTFLEGKAGPLALHALAQGKHNNEDNRFLDDLVTLGRTRVLALPEKECELLYGRVGYLYSLLFVRKHLDVPKFGDEIISQLLTQIVDIGLKGSEDNSSGAFTGFVWQWLNTRYLGAAHGMAGILYVLLECPRDLLLACNPALLVLIQKTVDHCLASYKFPSSNMKGSDTHDKDTLVHFCHGAPGWIPLLGKMAETFPDSESRYLLEAEAAGAVVWERGLLANKGPGICHGMAGSVCALLDVYRATGKKKWLWRAQQFASVLSIHYEQLAGFADNTYSLFQGISGAMYALGAVTAISQRHATADEKGVASIHFTSVFPGLGL